MLANSGNVTASGTISIRLFASDLDDVEAAASPIGNVITRTIRLLANHSIILHVGFTVPPNRPPGTYNIIAQTDSAATVTDQNNGNDIAVIAAAAAR